LGHYLSSPILHDVRAAADKGRMVTFPTLGALCDSIVAAIVREEGRLADDTNPGDLRDCPWFRRNPIHITGRFYPDGTAVAFKSIGAEGSFWNPRSRAEGLAGAFHVVALHVAELNSLAQLISDWAPPNENRTLLYLQNVQKWTGITDASVPLVSLIFPAAQAGQGVA
jgi:hypothetical protein